MRLRHVSENIANADTPGYHRKIITFEAEATGQVAAGPVRLDQTDAATDLRPRPPAGR